MARHFFTDRPGDAWHQLLTEIYGSWRIEERVLFPEAKAEWARRPTKHFVGVRSGKEYEDLVQAVRPDLAVGMRVTSPCRIGYCCSHGEPRFTQLLGHEPLNAGVMGTIVELGRDDPDRLCPRTHVVVEIDPGTVRGAKSWLECLPAGIPWRVCLACSPLMVVTQQQHEAIVYGGLFA